MLDSRYLRKLELGTFATIRRGVVKPESKIVYIHSGGSIVAKAEVVNVYYKAFKDLSDDEAKLEGFRNREELIRELKRIYKGVRDDEVFTVIVLKVVERLNIIDDGSAGLKPYEIARLALTYNIPLSDEDREILRELAKNRSIRLTAIRLTGGLEGRRRVREAVRRALRKLIELNVIPGGAKNAYYLVGQDNG